MNLSCLFFGGDGEVGFAEVLTVGTLADGIILAQATLKAQPSYAWFELWLDGERVASSHDQDPRSAPPLKNRGALH